MTPNDRLRSLARLATVYEMVAYTDGLSLDQTRAALHEVEALLERQSDLARRVVADGHEALTRADRQEWLLSESEVELALWNRSRLELLRGSRQELQEQAAERYRESLLEEGRIDALVARAQSAARRESERREQAAADDRYLARLRWRAQRARRRVKTP
ncbi:MAG TPA: hypothetical protein VH250_12120 [Granulicella sp.]|nr:hypothetical protein [Granulicella sp.]